jgi:hypothetical protein
MGDSNIKGMSGTFFFFGTPNECKNKKEVGIEYRRQINENRVGYIQEVNANPT